MGYHHLWGSEKISESHKIIALERILRGMGRWLPGYNRRTPEIEVTMISNYSRIYQPVLSRGWRRWVQRWRSRGQR